MKIDRDMPSQFYKPNFGDFVAVNFPVGNQQYEHDGIMKKIQNASKHSFPTEYYCK